MIGPVRSSFCAATTVSALKGSRLRPVIRLFGHAALVREVVTCKASPETRRTLSRNKPSRSHPPNPQCSFEEKPTTRATHTHTPTHTPLMRKRHGCGVDTDITSTILSLPQERSRWPAGQGPISVRVRQRGWCRRRFNCGSRSHGIVARRPTNPVGWWLASPSGHRIQQYRQIYSVPPTTSRYQPSLRD